MNHVDNKQRSTKGFTLVELLLAMSFISLLLLAVSMTIIQIANIYNRGLIIKELNQVSREIGDELELAMRSSSAFSITPGANRYVNNSTGGRLCMGQYTYVWNYGKAIDAKKQDLNVDTEGRVIVFSKVQDTGASYCTPGTNGTYPKIDPSKASEMIQSSEHALWIHAFTVSSEPTASDPLSSQQLYRISFSLGTADIKALNNTQTACVTPDVDPINSDLNYCSIQKFTIVLRAVNGVN